MALNNTTDRYNYIYGNNARKAERLYSGYQSTSPRKEKAAPAEKPRLQKKRRPVAKTHDTFDWKYTVMTLAALAVLAMGALFYVNETARMNQMAHQIKVLKSEKADLQSRQVSIRSELDKSINLDHIREYAEKKLNMSYPEHSEVIYYNQESSDYFRQYESVDKK